MVLCECQVSSQRVLVDKPRMKDSLDARRSRGLDDDGGRWACPNGSRKDWSWPDRKKGPRRGRRRRHTRVVSKCGCGPRRDDEKRNCESKDGATATRRCWHVDVLQTETGVAIIEARLFASSGVLATIRWSSW